MTQRQKIHFYSTLPSVERNLTAAAGDGAGQGSDRLEPSTCVEGEPFALRVLDDSMQPEFRRGCVIVIDPTAVPLMVALYWRIAVGNSQTVAENICFGNCGAMPAGNGL